MSTRQKFTFGDDLISAHLWSENNKLWLKFEGKLHGKNWGETRLLELEIYDTLCQRVDKIQNYRLDIVEKVSDGVHVILGDTMRKIDIGLWIRISDGELVVTLPMTEVYERNPLIFRLFAVNILPGLAKVNKGGSILLPVDSGYTFAPDDKPQCSDRFLIYGEQERWELLPNLPVCSVYEANGGLVLLATLGASDAECRVSTDGLGSGEIGFAASLRQYEHDPVNFETREFRYIAIPPNVNPLVFTAKRLRRHIMDDLEKKTLTERAEESPEVAYMLDAYIMKPFHGIEREGFGGAHLESDKPISFVSMMNFQETKGWLKKIHASGIDKVITLNTGWNARGHDGMYPTRFPVEERLGGEKEFRDLIKFGNNLGYHINVHDCYSEAYITSPDLNLNTTARDRYGNPQIKGWWGGGISYLQWPLLFGNEALAGQMKKIKSLGVKGMFYADGMPGPLYRNYDSNCTGSRAEHAKGIVRIIETAKEIFGSCGTEQGFLYGVIPADHIVRCGGAFYRHQYRPEWPITILLDKRVPLWQLALHGLIVQENHSHATWETAMQIILFGDHPRTEWSVRPGFATIIDDNMVSNLKAMYDLCLKRFGYLQTLELIDYEELQKNVKKTQFADGTQVVADFNKKLLWVNNKLIKKTNSCL